MTLQRNDSKNQGTPKTAGRRESSYVVPFHERNLPLAEFLHTGSECIQHGGSINEGWRSSCIAGAHLHLSVLATLTFPHARAAPPNPETPQEEGLGALLPTTVSVQPRTLPGV